MPGMVDPILASYLGAGSLVLNEGCAGQRCIGTMRKVLLCVVILLAGAAPMSIVPAKATPRPEPGWSIGAGLVVKASWQRRYYGHYRYYSRRYGYYPPPYIFYPPPFPHYPPPYGYDLPYHYRYYPPY
jgi:hypothetical protein